MIKKVKTIRAIIYDIENGKPLFLILHRTLRWKGWEFLKETIEKEESVRQTLIRGIKEETRIKKFKIIKRLGVQEKWQANRINYVIADSFLVRADMREEIFLKQEVIEHDDYQWVNKETALKKLTWPKTKEILRDIKNSWLK